MFRMWQAIATWVYEERRARAFNRRNRLHIRRIRRMRRARERFITRVALRRRDWE